MTEVFQTISNKLLAGYTYLIANVPVTIQKFIPFLLLAIIIFIYANIIWAFYQSISKKDILGLNLRQ